MKKNKLHLVASLLIAGLTMTVPASSYGREGANGISQQSQKVTGVVVDSKGEPVIGATVKQLGASTGAITDLDGKFSLNLSAKSSLEISYVGYVTQKVEVIPGQSITITLQEDNNLVDEVVVVGYGSVKRSDLTGSVSSLDAASLTSASQTNAIDAMQGRISGVKDSRQYEIAVPDMAELLRGKCGRVYGDMMQLFTVMKGTPLAYNKDFQEDKESLFDAVDTWKACIRIFAGMLEKTAFRMDMIQKQLGKGFLNATDIAEHLAKQGIPFREAHSIVGRMVKACEHKGCDFDGLSDEDLRAIDPRVSTEVLGDISIPACVDARTSFGGTAPSEVRRQIQVGREWLHHVMQAEKETE